MAKEIIRRGWMLATILAVLGLLPLAGCGSRRVPIRGAVTLDGKPVNGGVLSFTPDASKGNTVRVTCTAPIKDGRYELQSSGVLRSESGSGAPLGWYKVTLINAPGPKLDIPEKYKNPDQTPLSIEVMDSPEPGHYDIKLVK